MIDLKAFRKGENIKQGDVCAVLNIAQPYLSAVESGKRPLNEAKFNLLYNHYGDVILKYKTTERPIIIAQTDESPRNYLQLFREENNFTQKKAAEYFGCTQAFISLVERGESKVPKGFISKIKADASISKDSLKGYFNSDINRNIKNNAIKYWTDVDATGGDIMQFDDSINSNVEHIIIPGFQDCTDAVNLYGDSMSPRYKSGEIILLKEWVESFIEYGNIYLIITRKGHRMVKYLRRTENHGEILCCSENSSYDSFVIEREDILRLYLVKGAIEKTTL